MKLRQEEEGIIVKGIHREKRRKNVKVKFLVGGITLELVELIEKEDKNLSLPI